MKAVILAGGEGRRLRPVTGDTPKPMVELVGVPVMERTVRLLRTQGFSELCAALCYRPEVIEDYFGDGSRFGVKMQYRVQDTPRGTAGSVLQCADFYGDEDFLVVSGDAVFDFDLAALMARHKTAHAAVRMALHPSAEPLQYGLVLLDRDSRVRHFVEKPDWGHVVTNLVNTGIYCISPDAMGYVRPDEPQDFARDLFPTLLASGEHLLGVPTEGYWCDIGTPRSYYQCSLDVLDGRLATEPITPPAAGEDPPAQENTRVIPCRDRARLMRAASEAFWELGADFTDGLQFQDGSWRIALRPSAKEASLLLNASTPEAADTAARLVRLMEDRIGSAAQRQ